MKKIILISMALFFSGSALFAAARKQVVLPEPSHLMSELKALQAETVSLNDLFRRGEGVIDADKERELGQTFIQLVDQFLIVYGGTAQGMFFKQLKDDVVSAQGMGFISTDFILEKALEILNFLGEQDGVVAEGGGDDEVGPDIVSVYDKIQILIAPFLVADFNPKVADGFTPDQIGAVIEAIEALKPLFEKLKTEMRVVDKKALDKLLKNATDLGKKPKRRASAKQKEKIGNAVKALKAISVLLKKHAKKPFYAPTRSAEDDEDEARSWCSSRTCLKVLATLTCVLVLLQLYGG